MTIFLVRHGSAGRRNDNDPSDVERHLDDVGEAQAKALIKVLADSAPQRVMSSHAIRCVETVTPLAHALGHHVELNDSLFEGSPIERSWELVESLASSGTTAVLCSHGDVIPDVISRAKGRGMIIPGKAGCSKGSIWALEWDGDHFSTGVYQPNRGE